MDFLVKADDFFWWYITHYCLLIPIPEHIRMTYDITLVLQDTASAAAQRERESLDELRGYKDQLEVGSEAVSIVEP